MEKKIKKIFKDLQIDIRFNGYKIWLELVKLAKEQESELIHMESLYKELAKRTNSTRNRIERNARYIIEKYELEIQGYFEYYNKITPKSFLALLLEELEEV